MLYELPHHNQATYRRLFELIKDKGMENGADISANLQIVQLDFEAAIHAAVCHCFLLTRVRGCLFNFSQAIWQKVQDCSYAC